MRSQRERVFQSDASPGTKVRCCYIACLSFGISFLLTSFVSFVPAGGQRGLAILTISAKSKPFGFLPFHFGIAQKYARALAKSSRLTCRKGM
jgi:hypothetical protein